MTDKNDLCECGHPHKGRECDICKLWNYAECMEFRPVRVAPSGEDAPGRRCGAANTALEAELERLREEREECQTCAKLDARINELEKYIGG